MPAPAWISGFLRWRWMPLVALVSGSLAFVAIAVLVVPEELGSAAGGSRQSARSRSLLAENAGSTKESRFALPRLEALMPEEGDEEASAPKRQAASSLGDESNVVQSIFHSAPPIELPVAPPDPNPAPPPPEPPPPPPAATIFTLENPPPLPQPQVAALNAPPGVVAEPQPSIVPEATPPVPAPPVPAPPVPAPPVSEPPVPAPPAP